jgi:hypothetical protein
MQLRSLTLLALFAVSFGHAPSVQAGPLIDWLFRGRTQPQPYAVGAPVPLGNGYGSVPAYGTAYAGYPGYTGGPSYGPAPVNAYGSYSAAYAPASSYAANYGYAANLGNYYHSQLPVIGPNGAGYSAPLPTGTAAATLPTPMSYVPNFNSQALRAPVTYYRPVLTTDPNTGAQVVAMAPCTSYQYMTQRVPALGQSALYGNYQPPRPLPAQNMPSYTLPSGGIPLASSIYAPAYGGYPTATAPNPTMMGSGTALGYSPYSTYQISPPSTGHTTYPTNPSATNYYSAPSGGSTGTYYSPSVPGLVAPPVYSTPNYSSPTFSAPSAPLGSSVLPPSTGSSSTDPGSLAPTLPPTQTLRPKLQSIVPGATQSGSESAARIPAASERSLLSEPNREFPSLNPIPAPEGMQKPTWSPSLLRTEDMTALRPSVRSAHFAGQSKKISWASFEKSASESAGIGQSDQAASTGLRPSRKQLQQSLELPSQSNRQEAEPAQIQSAAKPAFSQLEMGGWKPSR